MNKSKLPVWAIAAFVLTAVLALYSVHKRSQIEAMNKAVAVSVEYDTLQSLAASQGMPIGPALKDLQAQGLNAVVLSESYLSELVGNGQVELSEADDPEPSTTISFVDPGVRDRVIRGLQTRFQSLASGLKVTRNAVTLAGMPAWVVRSTSIGLDPAQAAEAKAAGLIIIGRFNNPQGVSSETVRETLAWAKELGCSIYLPQGDQVLGRRDALPATIAALKSLGIYYASPEFAKIGGDDDVVGQAPEMVLRLHSAQVAELDKMSVPDAIDRYSKAARERNMRVLLVRPISLGADQPVADLAAFLKGIDTQVQQDGETLGKPHGFSDPGIPKPFFVLLSVPIAVVAYFVGWRLTSKRKLRIAGRIVLALMVALCITRTGLHGMALLASMIFPIAGFLILDDFADGRRKPSIRNILAGFAIVSLLSVVGGLAVAGLLNGLAFYVKADEFKAVKLSVFLPIVAVGAYYFLRLNDWRTALKSPITWGASALGLIILAALGFMLARTGNDSGVGASSGEIVFRNLLDKYLYVRPRTKEFLFGHPCLILATGFLLGLRSKQAAAGVDGPSPWGGWVALLLMLGAVGQTDVVNTLTHLHIPVVLSLARIGEGLVIGCIIGLLLWIVAAQLAGKREG